MESVTSRDIEMQTKRALARRFLTKSNLSVREIARNSGLSKSSVEQLAREVAQERTKRTVQE